MPIIESLLGAITLTFVHLFAGGLRSLNTLPRSRWLSAAGGVAVAYAIVHLLPELAAHQQKLQGVHDDTERTFLTEHFVWMLVLTGLVAFYGLEKAALKFRIRGESVSQQLYWLHIAFYSVYNALLGYLLVREDRSVSSLVFFVVGIGLHFVVNDHGLRQHHRQRYHHTGRWVLSAAVLIGWAGGIATTLDEMVTASAIALLAGGILLNTFKEELPEEKESRFWAFALGAIGYAAVMLAM